MWKPAYSLSSFIMKPEVGRMAWSRRSWVYTCEMEDFSEWPSCSRILKEVLASVEERYRQLLSHRRKWWLFWFCWMFRSTKKPRSSSLKPLHGASFADCASVKSKREL